MNYGLHVKFLNRLFCVFLEPHTLFGNAFNPYEVLHEGFWLKIHLDVTNYMLSKLNFQMDLSTQIIYMRNR